MVEQAIAVRLEQIRQENSALAEHSEQLQQDVTQGEASEEHMIDEFKRFLDRVSAEDFAEAEIEEEED